MVVCQDIFASTHEVHTMYRISKTSANTMKAALQSYRNTLFKNQSYLQCIGGMCVTNGAYSECVRIGDASDVPINDLCNILNDVIVACESETESLCTFESCILKLCQYLLLLSLGIQEKNDTVVQCLSHWKLWQGYRNVWIIKPVGLACGQKIEVVCGLERVIHALRELEYKCVIQKYIEMPLLVRKQQKFDIRQWVLVTSTDPLVIYGFSECYARLSTIQYSLNEHSLENPAVHLCNFAVQKVNQHTVHADENPGEQFAAHLCETMMSQRELCANLSEIFHADGDMLFKHRILPSIREASIASIQSVRDRLVTVGKGFEWLGLDFMIGLNHPGLLDNSYSGVEAENMEVLLLEVNVSPDISLSTPVTSRLVPPATEHLFELILDDHVLDVTPTPTYLPPNSALANDIDKVDTGTVSNWNNCDSGMLKWELWYSGMKRSPVLDQQFNVFKSQKRHLNLNCKLSLNSQGKRSIDALCSGGEDISNNNGSITDEVQVNSFESFENKLKKGDDVVVDAPQNVSVNEDFSSDDEM